MNPPLAGLLAERHLRIKVDDETIVSPGKAEANPGPFAALGDGQLNIAHDEVLTLWLLEAAFITQHALKGTARETHLQAVTEVLIALGTDGMVQHGRLFELAKRFRQYVLA